MRISGLVLFLYSLSTVQNSVLTVRYEDDLSQKIL